MAQRDMVLLLTVRRRWWVLPAMWVVIVFAWSVSWALDDEDDRLDQLVARWARIVAERGIYVEATPEGQVKS